MARLTTTTSSHETTTDMIMDDDLPLALRRPRRKSSINNLTTTTVGNPQPAINRSNKSNHVHGLSTPPATPQRTKKRVRFSDPGPSNNTNVNDEDELPSSPSTSTGLTPFIRRTSLLASPPPSGSRSSSSRSQRNSKRSTPAHRRHSAPLPSSLWNLASSPTSGPGAVNADTPISGTLHFAPLRQVLTGRVKRRLRRNHLSEEVQMIELETRRRRKGQAEEIARLRRELVVKDEEIRNVREGVELWRQIGGEAGLDLDVNGQGGENSQSLHRIWELENQVKVLREELGRREKEGEEEWTLAGRDPFLADDERDDDDDLDLDQDQDQCRPFEFDEGMDFSMGMAEDSEVLVSTPHRRQAEVQIHVQSTNSQDSSIPSPPATLPGTPRHNRSQALATPTKDQQDEGVQVNIQLPDVEKEHLKKKLHILEAELEALRSLLEKNDTLSERLRSKMLPYLSTAESSDQTSSTDVDIDTALDTILTSLALSQSSVQENSARFTSLATDLSTFGFSPATDPEATITTLTTQFRNARLQLEYLFPGETTTGFSPPKLLDLLLTRLKGLKALVDKREADIDQYHALESNLRTQLAARVDAQGVLQQRLESEKRERDNEVKRREELEKEVQEKEEGLSRLKYALDGYREDVKQLEIIVGKLEADGKEKDELAFQLRAEFEAAQREKDDRLLSAQLENETLAAERDGLDLLNAELKRRLDAALDAAEKVKAEKEALERQLADLKELISKREAEHGAALALKDARFAEVMEENAQVNGRLKETSKDRDMEREKRRLAEERVERVRDVVDIRSGSATASTSARRSISVYGDGNGNGTTTEVRMMNGMLARRASGRGKKRRRYDSGLGFLEEEDELDGMETS